MPHYKKSFPSKWLQTSDLDAPIVATIAGVRNEMIGTGDDRESKPIVKFRESEIKGLVLNLTKCEAIASIAGDDDTDKWSGTRIRLSRGTTRFQGKKVGCIVVDAPRAAAKDDIDAARPTLDDEQVL